VTLGRDGTLVAVGRETLATRHGDFVVHRFHNLTTGAAPLAVAFGDLHGDEPLLARVHSSCITSEAYGACDCDCAEQLDGALAHVASRGRGVLFYLIQEGRGAGVVAKALDRMLVQASGGRLTTFEAYARLGIPDDQRTYGEVAGMARLLGVRAPLRLLSNNPGKVSAVAAAGALLDGTEPLQIRPSAYSRNYLDAKSRAGQTVASTVGVDAAVLPEPVVVIEPEPLADHPGLVRLASYLLPVRGADAAWFRLHAYLDTAARHERIVLTHGTGGDDALVRLQREHLLDRFPRRTPSRRRTWDEAVAHLVAHGRGIVLFAPEGDAVADVVGPLVGAHLGGRRGVPLVLDGDDPADTALVERALDTRT
jgi:3,4-dihydroxy 2-butanone 4-phosphate synthase / GTP cyclohydrolase II